MGFQVLDLTRPLGGRIAGCRTPPHRSPRCPAPAPPQDQATHAVTMNCVGFAGP